MVKQSEVSIKRKIDVWIKDNMPCAYVYKPRGGPYGQAGTPDYFICWNGCFIGIEVKIEGADPRPLQLAALRRIQAAGGIAAVIRGFDTVRLNQIKQHALERCLTH